MKNVLTLALAKKIAAAAESEAAKNNWTVAISLVDDGGHLVYLQRMDETQYASVEIATQKAQTSSGFKRSTKVIEDAVAGGRTMLLSLPMIALEGGLPLSLDGKVIGAIGVSGMTSQQDGVVAKAGVDAFAELTKK